MLQKRSALLSIVNSGNKRKSGKQPVLNSNCFTTHVELNNNIMRSANFAKKEKRHDEEDGGRERERETDRQIDRISKEYEEDKINVCVCVQRMNLVR